MKKIFLQKTKLIILFSAFIMISTVAKSQNSFGHWILPIGMGDNSTNIAHQSILLTFSEQGIHETVLNDSLSYIINPVNSPLFSGGGYNDSGEFEFYLIGGYLFFRNGSVYVLSSYNMLNMTDFQIIKIPDTESEYYIIYGRKSTNKEAVKISDLEYVHIKIDASDNIIIDEPVLIVNGAKGCAFATSKLDENGEGFLYESSLWGLFQHTINQDTIYPLSYSHPVDTLLYEHKNWELTAYNLELKDNSSDNPIIAWIIYTDGIYDPIKSYYDKIKIHHNGGGLNNLIEVTGLGTIGGIEFTKRNENILYASCDLGIVKINYNNGVILGTLPNSQDYQRTYLQTAPDGHIYGVHNDGTKLGRINMETGIFEANVYSFPNVDTFNILNTYMVFENKMYFTLPENENTFDALFASSEIVNESCPDFMDGTMKFYVVGGEPPYSMNVTYQDGTNIPVTWTDDSYFFAENLTAGTYTYEINDANNYNPITGSFVIIVDFTGYDFYENYFVVDTEDYTFPNTEYPEDNYSFAHGIIVKNNKTLTINNSTFNFSDIANIIIEPGSKLIVNNSTLIHYIECDQKWQGIQVWGDRDEHQFGQAQGRLVLQKNSTIEHAILAVDLMKPGDNSKTGGIVQATNAMFRNNTKSLRAYHYQNRHPVTEREMDNLSYFTHCYFETTDEYIIDDNKFYLHVDLWDVKGFSFTHCNFFVDASLNNEDNVSTWTKGIQSSSAGFSVKGWCDPGTSPPCPENDYDRSSFDGFYMGISATNNAENNYTFSVNRTDFENNSYGIHNSSINGASVLNSNFEVGRNRDFDKCQDPKTNYSYGINFEQAQHFAIENNEFKKDAPAPAGDNYCGIRIFESKTEYDLIYRNLN